jgi:hypothetical protein
MDNLFVLNWLGTLKITHLISSVSALWRCPVNLKVGIASSQWHVVSSIGGPNKSHRDLDRKVLQRRKR